MSRPIPNRIVRALPDAVPFVAPEHYEREMGQPFRARLGANESVFGASPAAIEAMAKKSAKTQWYGDPQAFEVREELARKHNLTIDHFVMGPGIDGLFGHIAAAYLDSSSKVVTTHGSYPTFEYAVRSVGAEILTVPYKDHKADLDNLANKATMHNASIVYLANPDNPSGSFHAPEAITAFLNALPANILVVLDEAYLDFVDPFELDDPRVIRLRTFSKAYGMAGCRIGYAMGDPETVQPLNRIRLHFEVNSVAQAGALASLRDEKHLPKVNEQTRLAKYDLSEMLEKLGLYTLPSYTNFLLADATTNERAEAIMIGLRKLGVFIRKPGLPPLDRYIRVTVGYEEDHSILIEALKQLDL